MPAFDVTTNPLKLSPLKPGEQAKIVATVTNRLGRRVKARAFADVEPESFKTLVKPPSDFERSFAQTGATEDFVFTVQVPANAAPGSFTVAIVACESVLPDDNFGSSAPLTVTIIPGDGGGAKPRPKRWWIWVLVGAAVVGLGALIWALTHHAKPPNPQPPAPPPASQPAPAPTRPALSVRLFSLTSSLETHPEARVTVPAGYKIISGGAHVDYQDPGNLLTASYPDGPSAWVVRSKDHVQPSPARVEAWAVALYDPNDEWEVRVVSATSSPAAHPAVSATLPPGYTMTGGGAQVHWTGAGNLLTASYPQSPRSWEAKSKDHTRSDPAALTVYVIGIRPRNGAPPPESSIFSAQSGRENHPTSTASIPSGYLLVGGGAEVNWQGAGNLLTASYPNNAGGWIAASKDHLVADPSVITAYAIGVRP